MYNDVFRVAPGTRMMMCEFGQRFGWTVKHLVKLEGGCPNEVCVLGDW
jgi:hypothetical protein